MFESGELCYLPPCATDFLYDLRSGHFTFFMFHFPVYLDYKPMGQEMSLAVCLYSP